MNTENAVTANDTLDVELDSAWGDDETVSEATETTESAPVSQEPQEEAKTAQEGENGENQASQPETYTLKNRILGDRQVTKEEYDVFAHKGLDYDRVQQERDQLREYKKEADPAYAAIKEYAKRAGFGDNIPGFLDALREQELRQSGKTEAEAKNIVAQEKREADLTAREQAVAAKEQAQTSAETEAKKAKERQQKNVEDFYRIYPNVKPEDIPKDVWDAVFNKGDTLTNAYTMHENKRLQAELAAERKNKENKASAPGSLSASPASEQDEIDRLWAEDDF